MVVCDSSLVLVYFLHKTAFFTNLAKYKNILFMIKVGILGAAGYAGGELIRLLLNHPQVEIVFANSESNAGNPVCDIHEGL